MLVSVLCVVLDVCVRMLSNGECKCLWVCCFMMEVFVGMLECAISVSGYVMLCCTVCVCFLLLFFFCSLTCMLELQPVHNF